MPTRRDVIMLIGLSAVAAMVWQSTAWAAPRPNILWISCEDTSRHFGSYGDPHAITPTIGARSRRLPSSGRSSNCSQAIK